MSYGFVKIYGTKLITSSLWDEAPEARLVFLSMLAIADQNGYVDVPNERALARVLNLPDDYLKRGLDVLMKPDPGSRTASHEGRRIVRQEPGWLCVNYEQYREFRSAKQEADRIRIAALRAAKAAPKPPRKRALAHLANGIEPLSRHDAAMARTLMTEFEPPDTKSDL